MLPAGKALYVGDSDSSSVRPRREAGGGVDVRGQSM